MHGEHCIRSYSKTQTLVALSSAEAELYAIVVLFRAMAMHRAPFSKFTVRVDTSYVVNGIAADDRSRYISNVNSRR